MIPSSDPPAAAPPPPPPCAAEELAPALADPRAALEALGRRADELRAARDELLPAAGGSGPRGGSRQTSRLLAVEVALEDVERARAAQRERQW